MVNSITDLAVTDNNKIVNTWCNSDVIVDGNSDSPSAKSKVVWLDWAKQKEKLKNQSNYTKESIFL